MVNDQETTMAVIAMVATVMATAMVMDIAMGVQATVMGTVMTMVQVTGMDEEKWRKARANWPRERDPPCGGC